MQPRFLIFNGDDFGLTSGINRGIIEAHERGIVTSASLMVRYPAAVQAAEYARAHPRLSVGLHFELAEWRYCAGEWKAAYEVVDARDATAVAAEFSQQLEIFERLMERTPTHLDSHQHVHLSEPARSLLLAEAARLQVPLRGLDSSIRYCGSFYGQTGEGESLSAAISSSSLIKLMRDAEQGWTEYGCHPGYAEGLDSVYLTEREVELSVLCASELRGVFAENNLRLSSFRDYLDLRNASAKS